MCNRKKMTGRNVNPGLTEPSKFDLLVRWPIVMTFTIVLMFRIRAGLAGPAMIRLPERLGLA